MLLTLQNFFSLFFKIKLVSCFRFKSNLTCAKTTSFGNENILKIEELSKKYRRNSTKALCSVDFKIRNNSFVFLLGHNGAGKSTLINILGDVIPKTSGTLTKYSSKKFAICFHENSLYSSLTVIENLDIFHNILSFDSKPYGSPECQ